MGVRLGRQFVIWGAADGVRVTDLVSPMDMTEFLAQDYDDIRMPVNALRFFVFKDKMQFELLVVPAFEGYRLSTDAANPWSVLPKENLLPLVWNEKEASPNSAYPTWNTGKALFHLARSRLLFGRTTHVEQDARSHVPILSHETLRLAPPLPHGVRRRRCLKTLGAIRVTR